MRRLLGVLLVATLALPGGALAKKKEKEHKKDKDRDVDVQVSIAFAPRERDKVREYFVKSHGRGKCPPGLAKKGNGCLPPGQAKKRYVVGRSLPPTVVIQDLPGDLSVRIGPAPKGYRYAIVDGDFVKLAVGTMLVVDAIEGLVD